MRRKVPSGHKGGFLKHHDLSIATLAILILWIALYVHSDGKTHWGAFFGNATADWTGVLVAVIATKYFYETGSAESKRPTGDFRSRIPKSLRSHSLSIFLGVTGVGWTLLYLKMNPNGKWGQVIGNIVSEWTQLLGLVLLTKRLVEDRSKESRK